MERVCRGGERRIERVCREGERRMERVCRGGRREGINGREDGEGV